MKDIVIPNWPAPPNIKAFSTTRLGGVSQPPYKGLNLGAHVGDISSVVSANRTRLELELGLPKQPIWLDQTHSVNVVDLANGSFSASADGSLPANGSLSAEGSLSADGPIKADGSFTSAKGQVCAVMTADCLPLLLTDRAGSFVAAVHAGWRGMADGIIERALAAIACNTSHVLAWAGPCIGAAHFEVGLEVKEQLGGPSSAYSPHPNSAKVYADLVALAKQRLLDKGVKEFYSANLCTYSDPQRFFSYRRDGMTGRMATLIWAEE